MKKTLLVLADEADSHADAVAFLAGTRGLRVVRLDLTQLHISRETVSFAINAESTSARIGNGIDTTNIDEIGAIYCRRWAFPKPDFGLPIDQHLRIHEINAAYYGLLTSMTDKYWMNHPAAEDLVDNKMVQGLAARSFGLCVPKTLVSDDPDEVGKFFDQLGGRVIIKQLSEISLIDRIDNSENGLPAVYGFYTSRVKKEDLQFVEEVRNAPCLFQERIDKVADIRVTVVENEVFAHRIYSQASEASSTDFRRVIGLKTENCEIPVDIAIKLKMMLRSWDIRFASCDFALSHRGEYIFLEANVTGNWLWLESTEHHPILDRVVGQLHDACL